MAPIGLYARLCHTFFFILLLVWSDAFVDGRPGAGPPIMGPTRIFCRVQVGGGAKIEAPLH